MKQVIISMFVLTALNPLMIYSQSIDKVLDKLKNNVAKITSTFENGKDENGFGIVVAERANKLYIVTAKHVIYDLDFKSKTKSVRINFQSHPGQNYSASLINLPETSTDISLLVVDKPVGYTWSKKHYSKDVRKGTQVWFIGRAGEWYTPAAPGLINRATSNEIFIEINSIQPGTSGAPLISYNGIVGLIFEDAPGVAKAYRVDKIINLITKTWSYEWQIKLNNIQQEIHFGVGGQGWRNQGLEDYINFDLGLDPDDFRIKRTGTICFGYRHYFLNKKIAIGATAVVENHVANYRSKERYRLNGLYFLLESRYYYIHHRRFQLYTGFSPGIAMVTTKDTSFSKSSSEFAFQVNLIGFRAGGRVGIFGEGGVGYKGVYNLGISARF